MEKTLLYQDKNVKKYLVKFFKDEIAKIEDKLVREINNSYTFEGFRKGKVPKEIIKLRFGESFNELLMEEAEHELRHKISEEEKLLFPITIESKAQEDDHIEFEILIHTYPEIKNINYENMVVRVPSSKEIVEDYIQNRLDELLNSNAILEPKDSPAKDGDYVRIVYDLIDENGEILSKDEETEITIRENDERPLVKAIIGKNNKEEFEITKEDEGRKLTQKVRVEQIYTRKLPELNDNFVKELNIEVETLSALKEKLKKEGEEAVKSWQEDFIINYILGELPHYVEIDISEDSLNYYIDSYITDLKNKGKYEEQLEKLGNDENKLREEVKKSALNWIKDIVTIEKIAKENNISVTEEELSQAIKNFGSVYGLSYANTREIISSNPQILEEIAWEELRKKVAKFIKDKVKIEEFTKEDEEIAESENDVPESAQPEPEANDESKVQKE